MNRDNTDIYDLEHWRLSESLSVVDASILITGNNPSDQVILEDEYAYKKTFHHPNFEPVFKAIRTAIFDNKLAARLVYGAREEKLETDMFDGENYQVTAGPQETKIEFPHLLAVSSSDLTIRTSSSIRLEELTEFFLFNEPNWRQTTIEVDDLKAWLASREFFPEFFFWCRQSK